MDKYIKMALIRPSKIQQYQERINNELSDDTVVLYSSRYFSVLDFIKDNSNMVFGIAIPDSFFDRSEKGNDLAREIKSINKKNKVFSYSKERPLKTDMINIVITGLKSDEDEINNLISLLK